MNCPSCKKKAKVSNGNRYMCNDSLCPTCELNFHFCDKCKKSTQCKRNENDDWDRCNNCDWFEDGFHISCYQNEPRRKTWKERWR